MARVTSEEAAAQQEKEITELKEKLRKCEERGEHAQKAAEDKLNQNKKNEIDDRAAVLRKIIQIKAEKRPEIGQELKFIKEKYNKGQRNAFTFPSINEDVTNYLKDLEELKRKYIYKNWKVHVYNYNYNYYYLL